jgi:two-component system cell cycle sensor histidine kinase/response regulator CckA
LNFSEVKQIKNNLDQALKVAVLGQFTSEIIHDINNIVGAIQVATDLVEFKIQKNSGVESELSLIRKTADRASKLTKHLLAFCRSEKVELDEWSPGAATSEISEILQRILGKRCKLNINVQPNVGKIAGTQMQFEQILMNLTLNARDAMPNGGDIFVEVKNKMLPEGFQDISGKSFAPGEYVKIRVKDSGVGIDEPSKKNIFDPYFTTKQNGTGLGLGTVMSIVKKMNGGIILESQPGNGADFKIFIPAVKAVPLSLKIA